jgi:hypothetical protein
MAVSFSGARVWLGALCVVAMAGCGGRTSMLAADDDPGFGSSEPNGGSPGVSGSPSTTHPTPSGGATGTPAGGATSTPAGGATAGGSSGIAGAPSSGSGGEAGTFTGNAVAACSNFCGQAAMSNCSDQFGNYPDCVNNCSSELGSSPLCLQLGQAVMNCFLPYFRNNFGRCLDINDYLATICAPQLAQFQQCSGSDVPTPAPVPTPVPLPLPTPAPSTCSTMGSTSAVTCDLTSKCMDGSYYMVNCKQSSQGDSSCTCQSGNAMGGGAAAFSLHESVAFACYDGISTCGGPVPTLPK